MCCTDELSKSKTTAAGSLIFYIYIYVYVCILPIKRKIAHFKAVFNALQKYLPQTKPFPVQRTEFIFKNYKIVERQSYRYKISEEKP